MILLLFQLHAISTTGANTHYERQLEIWNNYAQQLLNYLQSYAFLPAIDTAK